MALNSVRMKQEDATFGSMAQCYVTINGRRFNFMQMTEFDANWETSSVDVPILGQTNVGHKLTGGSGTWSGTCYYNQSVIRKMADEFQKTGKATYFEIQVTNEDPTSRAGRQTIIYHNCLIDKYSLSKFEAGDAILTEELSGTFGSWDMPEEFTPLDGFEM